MKSRMAAIRVFNKAFEETFEPGEFEFTVGTTQETPQGMFYGCPCACGRLAHVSFSTWAGLTTSDARWTWDGVMDRPTLQPSLLSTQEKGGCGWHGYLIEGVWYDA